MTESAAERPHWLTEIDQMSDDPAVRSRMRALVVRETGAAHRAALEDLELEPVGYDGHGAPLYPHQLAVDNTPPDYFRPATTDPAVQLEGRYRVDGSTVHLQVRGPDAPPFEPLRFPRPVEVTREELGILEAGSPIRAYLNRHAAEAAVEREHAEQRIEDATRDFEAVVGRQQMIQRAIADLDELETDHGRLSRMIVGPVTSPSPTTTQEKS